MRDIERYLADKYRSGRKGISWKNLASDILPGYVPGRYDLDHSQRDKLNNALARLADAGYVTLRKYKAERAFTLYSVTFTDKMESLCGQYGIKTKCGIAKDVLDTLLPLRLSSPGISRWRDEQVSMAQTGQPDRRFWNDSCAAGDIGRAVLLADAIIRNKEEIYIRDLSKMVLGDSKAFSGKVKEKAEALLEKCSDSDALEKMADMKSRYGRGANIFLVYNVVSTPRHIPAFGDIEITTPFCVIDSRSMPYVFLSDAINKYQRIRIKTPDFITIENQTTYEDFFEDGYTKFYVGGFPGYAEKELLAKIYRDNPDVTFHHWGDIDCGGFRIFDNIRRYIPTLVPYNMDVDTLSKYADFAAPLTVNDKRYLLSADVEPFRELADYMVRHDMKLEQESVYAGERSRRRRPE